MYQKDYILRMIEMLGELLRAIFGKISKGSFNQAEESIREAYLTMLRKDSSFFQNIPSEKLTTTLIQDHNYTNAHLEILAELLYAEATLLYAENKKAESYPYFLKACRLFEFVEEAYRTFSQERLDKMSVIEMRIKETEKL
jgi:predicted translin family RNA/ssDNA-binding protein